MRLGIRISIVLLVLVSISCKKEPSSILSSSNSRLSGSVFGTSYSVIYQSNIDYKKQFDSLFYVINKSMSTYQSDSDISMINRDKNVEVENHFITVFKASEKVYNETNGAFDPTIGGVVNAWDFGPKGKIHNIDSLKIDSLMRGVGFNKLQLEKNNVIKPKGTYIDFNAIAKGYGVDVIAEFIQSENIENYLVETANLFTIKFY